MPVAALVALVGLALWWYRSTVQADTGTMAHDPQDATLPTISAGMTALAGAIAVAEGFGRPGAIPTRAHNPGDLVIPGWTGDTLGAEGISVFTNDAEGWRRLYHQLTLIATGRSAVYTLDDTFADLGAKWTATERDAWVSNVLASLVANGYDVDRETPLSAVLG